MDSFVQSIELFFVWSVNGALVAAFWLADHALPIATLPALTILLSHAPREQRSAGLAATLIGLIACLLVPQPIPVVILAMGWVGVAAVELDKFNPDTLRWRVIGGIAIYAIASIAWTVYTAYVSTISPQDWSGMIATGEAASTIAQGKSFLQTISIWGLWIIVPLGFFTLLLKGFFVHPPVIAAPANMIHTVRTQGEQADPLPEQRATGFRAWLPWGDR